MSDEGVERRLTTILAADVVGYRRLMATDEAGTLAQLKSHRKGLVMMPKLLNALVAGALVIAMTACGGCALTAAAVVPSAVGTAPVVGEYLVAGKGDSFWVARYDDVVQATLRAGEKLSLELKDEEIEEGRTKLRYVDGRGKEISLLIEHRTDTVTRVRFEVGSSEFSGFAHLFGRQIIHELNDAGAFLVDWSVEEDAHPE